MSSVYFISSLWCLCIYWNSLVKKFRNRGREFTFSGMISLHKRDVREVHRPLIAIVKINIIIIIFIIIRSTQTILRQCVCCESKISNVESQLTPGGLLDCFPIPRWGLWRQLRWGHFTGSWCWVCWPTLGYLIVLAGVIILRILVARLCQIARSREHTTTIYKHVSLYC